MVRVGVGACSASATGQRGPRPSGSEHTVGAHYLLFPQKDVDLEEDRKLSAEQLGCSSPGGGERDAGCPRGDPASLL